jgi:hypothetical protein
MRGGSLKTFVYLFITNLLRFPSTAVSFQCVFTKSSGVGAVQKIFSLLLKIRIFFTLLPNLQGAKGAGGGGVYFYTTNFKWVACRRRDLVKQREEQLAL